MFNIYNKNQIFERRFYGNEVDIVYHVSREKKVYRVLPLQTTPQAFWSQITLLVKTSNRVKKC